MVNEYVKLQLQKASFWMAQALCGTAAGTAQAASLPTTWQRLLASQQPVREVPVGKWDIK